MALVIEKSCEDELTDLKIIKSSSQLTRTLVLGYMLPLARKSFVDFNIILARTLWLDYMPHMARSRSLDYMGLVARSMPLDYIPGMALVIEKSCEDELTTCG
jgi:hypothetical protein